MHSKSKKSKRQAKPRTQRRCQKLAKARRQGKGTHMLWQRAWRPYALVFARDR